MSTPLRSPAPAQYRDEQAWLEAKRKSLGGSDIAALWGLHRFKTAHDVWLEKDRYINGVLVRGRVSDRKATPAMQAGRRLEDVAAQLFTERTGLQVRRAPMKHVIEFPHLGASIDRQILTGRDLNGDLVESHPLELKVPQFHNFQLWKRKGLPDDLILQGQCEALVWRKDKTTFAIYGPYADALISFPVPFNADVSRKIIEYSGEWWETHITQGKEPPLEPVAVPDLKDLPEVPGQVVYRTDEEFLQAAVDWREARELAKNADMLFELAKARMKDVVGQVGVYEIEDSMRFYFSERPGRASFDHKALAAFKPIDPITIAAELRQVFGDSLSLPVLTEIIERSRLDIARFFKTGAAYKELRGYVLKPSEEE